MPYAIVSNCSQAGCPNKALVRGKCTQHAQAAEAERGSRQQRGYDRKHDALRKQWAPIVATGRVKCARCGLLIKAGTKWDLGHNDEDRTRWTGPEHARCNRGAGGRAVKHRGRG
jgi:hypothetical protein